MSLEKDREVSHLTAIDRLTGAAKERLDNVLSHFKAKSSAVANESSQEAMEIVGYTTDYLLLPQIQKLFAKREIIITDLHTLDQETIAASLASWIAECKKNYPQATAFFSSRPLNENEKDKISSFFLHTLRNYKKELTMEYALEAYFITLEEYLEDRYPKAKPARGTQPLATRMKKTTGKLTRK